MFLPERALPLGGPCPEGRPPVLTSSDGHCSGRYASYWNASCYELNSSCPHITVFSVKIKVRIKPSAEATRSLKQWIIVWKKTSQLKAQDNSYSVVLFQVPVQSRSTCGILRMLLCGRILR